MLIRKKWTEKSVRAAMRKIAKHYNVKLVFLTEKEGYGGYNYGASAEESISIAPFIKVGKGRNKVLRPCSNPLECMFITFFHELSHCVLTEKIPGIIKPYGWCGTSRYNYEMWVSMLGIDEARKQGVVFSDDTIKWLMDEAASYMHSEESGHYNVVGRNITAQSYETIQDDFLKKAPKKSKIPN